VGAGLTCDFAFRSLQSAAATAAGCAACAGSAVASGTVWRVNKGSNAKTPAGVGAPTGIRSSVDPRRLPGAVRIMRQIESQMVDLLQVPRSGPPPRGPGWLTS
jgi:hypothetical protein